MKEFYQLTLDEIYSYFKVSKDSGISEKDISYKIERFGKNIINIKKKNSFWKLFFQQFESYLTLLLLFLVIFSVGVGIFSKDMEYFADSIIISFILLFNVIIGAYQNFKSEKTAEILNKMLENKALVLRDKKKITISSTEIFPGDIIFLNEGDKIPADARIIESEDLKVDESILTGESSSVRKFESIITEDTHISERKNMLYMNTFVVRGEAIAVIVETGRNTEMGKIANSLQETEKKSSFINEVDEVGKKISIIAILMIIMVAIILSLKGFGFISIFLIASALIIGSIPEGLPAILTFLLSRSIHDLSTKNVLVKNMTLLETLGGIDILCTDKTGTLTENKMKVKKLFIDNKIFDGNLTINGKNFEMFTYSSVLSNEAKIIDNEIKGEAEDVALLNFAKENDIDWADIRKKNKILEFLPFSSETKYSLAKIKINEKTVVLKKGAPEIILNSCSYILENEKIMLLDENKRKSIEKNYVDFAKEALRVIAFSYSEKEGKEIFVGFIGMYDAPKKGVKETITTLYSAGIDVRMITGDNKDTAVAIAKECGFKNPKAISWIDIKNLNDDEFVEIVKDHNIFARMTPDFKEKIVDILKKNGYRVAITGDGVNDSIALKKADVGIVMGNGSDVAKESGDMILLTNDFNAIPFAIESGRTIFKNIRKVVNYLLTANLAEVLTIFLASFFGLVPFTAIQILWVNFVTDVAPAMALGFDPAPKKIMEEKPTGKSENILNKRIILLTVFISLKKVLLIFSVFLLAYYFTKNLIFSQTIAFTWLVLTHFARIAAIRFDEGINIFINKYVNWAILLTVILQLIILYSPLARFFKVIPINMDWWWVLIFFIAVDVSTAKLISLFIKYLLRNDKNLDSY